jgi:uncharacterized coiled-coil protein SlyX
MTSAEISERFMLLETKVAYQEKLLDDLNQVLLERGRQVDDLSRQLQSALDTLRSTLKDPKPGHEPPPHY